jgi:hypothetical protein
LWVGWCVTNLMWALLLLEQKRLELSESEERSYLTYALLKLLPVLRTINTEQQEELVMEAKLHGSLPVHFKSPNSMLLCLSLICWYVFQCLNPCSHHWVCVRDMFRFALSSEQNITVYFSTLTVGADEVISSS